MVRLKELAMLKECLGYVRFQFQYGSIKRNPTKDFRAYDNLISIPIWFD